MNMILKYLEEHIAGVRIIIEKQQMEVCNSGFGGHKQWFEAAALAHGLAEAAGRLDALMNIRLVAERDVSDLRKAFELLTLAAKIATKADDSWSGRLNDSRRMFHDGECSAVKDVVAFIEYQWMPTLIKEAEANQ